MLVYQRVKQLDVDGLEHLLFFHILGMRIATDLILLEGLKPPSRLDVYLIPHEHWLLNPDWLMIGFLDYNS